MIGWACVAPLQRRGVVVHEPDGTWAVYTEPNGYAGGYLFEADALEELERMR